jgi:hypothetical protein
MPETDDKERLLKGVKKGAVKSWQIAKLKPEVRELHYYLADNFAGDYVLTDAYRERTAKYGSSTSTHFEGGAIDLRVNPKVYNFLMNDKEGLKLMDKAGLGLYDESDPRNMRVATAKHFHLGSDFHETTKQRLAQFEELEELGEEVPQLNYFYNQHPDFDYEDFKQARSKNKGDFKNFAVNYLAENYYGKLMPNEDARKDIFTVYTKTTGKSPQGLSFDEMRLAIAKTAPSGLVFEYNEHDHDHGQESEGGFGGGYATTNTDDDPQLKEIKEQNKLLKEQIDRQHEVAEEKKRKLEEQEELKKLREKEEEKLSVFEQLTSADPYVERAKPPQQQQHYSYQPTPVQQSQMMDLPNIWDFGEQQTFEEGGEVGSKGVPTALLLKQAYKESTFNPKAVSPSGYKGLTQIGDQVIEDFVKDTGYEGEVDPFNPKHAVMVQKYTMNDLYNSSFINKPNQTEQVRLAKTLAAYNWGRGNLSKYLSKKKEEGVDIYQSLDWIEGLPTESKDYINKLLLEKDEDFENEYRQALTQDSVKDTLALYDYEDAPKRTVPQNGSGEARLYNLTKMREPYSNQVPYLK